jgi:hypothetical protein
LKYQDYRFSVAPMMDWSESRRISNSWMIACARCVHRDIKENLGTAIVAVELKDSALTHALETEPVRLGGSMQRHDRRLREGVG